MSEKNKREFGKEGEDIAENYLKEKGLQIIERNYHFSNIGEIDIVAKDQNQTVFVEVKSRLNLEYGEPEYAITPRKIKQIKKMAELYMFDKGIEEIDCRFDVITVVIGDGKNPEIKHYLNAFD